ncbi:DUF4169 family protein [Thalassococcus sp. BH17M4-6]|uniref:DUF4169 family protein n=1 Tax=Thalassococcus sp. BH17M4-6 TaxID=3413148 RepID=UPI003BCB5134
MSTPVNLNRFRKEKARAEKKARADRNAVTHGRTKAEKRLDEALRDKADKALDGKKQDG